MTGVRSPEAKQNRQVERPDITVAIEVGRAQLELVGAHVRNRGVAASIRSLRAIFGIRVIDEARVAVEVERNRLIRVAVIVEVGFVGGDG